MGLRMSEVSGWGDDGVPDRSNVPRLETGLNAASAGPGSCPPRLAAAAYRGDEADADAVAEAAGLLRGDDNLDSDDDGIMGPSLLPEEEEG